MGPHLEPVKEIKNSTWIMDVIFNECGALFWWKAYISNEVLWADQLYSLSLLPSQLQ